MISFYVLVHVEVSYYKKITEYFGKITDYQIGELLLTKTINLW